MQRNEGWRVFKCASTLRSHTITVSGQSLSEADSFGALKFVVLRRRKR